MTYLRNKERRARRDVARWLAGAQERERKAAEQRRFEENLQDIYNNEYLELIKQKSEDKNEIALLTFCVYVLKGRGDAVTLLKTITTIIEDVEVIEAQHDVDVITMNMFEEMNIVIVRVPIYDVAKTTEKLNEELHAALKKAEDALDAMAIATMANGANISHAILRVAEELRGLGYDLHATTHGIKSPRKTKP